jgi:predicted TIM-barrel fold metal-dependent hydrolase
MDLVVDCHVHPAFDSGLFKMYAMDGRTDFTLGGLLAEMRATRVEAAATYASYVPEFMLTNERLLDIVRGNPKLIPIGSFDPQHPDTSRLRRYLAEKKLRGLKMYAGYWNYYPWDKRFNGVLDLCEEFRVPLFIHTGDTLTRSGNLKYSRPIHVDELSVNRPDLSVVMCHAGLPWLEEAAEVAYKNENVMLDLSGLYIEHGAPYRAAFLRRISERVEYAIYYIGTVERKVLFGSDWPLARMRGVIEFIKRLHIKAEDKALILGKNAKQLLGLEI